MRNQKCACAPTRLGRAVHVCRCGPGTHQSTPPPVPPHQRTYLVPIHHVNDGRQLAVVGAVVDQHHAANLDKARKQLWVGEKG